MIRQKLKFSPIIGIEVHVELKTKSKMFCGCPADHFQAKPNTQTCPVCLGLPGALPVPNLKAIEWCLLIGRALECEIQSHAKFDRKNYFYPDLAKGFQISQYDQPFCRKGKLVLKGSSFFLKDDPYQNPYQTIRINRVHLEEDTGKLIHDQGDYTLIDFNRSGVPLVEIVTEPDINSAAEAVAYLKKLQQIIRYLDVSDCDMEKGSMRCEINISLLKKTQILKLKTQNKKSKLKTLIPNYKVEIKNINSFKFVKKAIEYEIHRQARILETGQAPIQETRGFNETKGITYSQRSKEEAHDYRYFPEPDIPPIKSTNQLINKLTNQLIELPDEKITRFIKQYQLTPYNSEALCQEKAIADYFEQAVKGTKEIKTFHHLANLIINKKINIAKIPALELVLSLRQQQAGLITDETKLKTIIKVVLNKNQQAVRDYNDGKTQALGFLIGQAMKETRGRAHPELVRKLLLEKL